MNPTQKPQPDLRQMSQEDFYRWATGGLPAPIADQPLCTACGQPLPLVYTGDEPLCSDCVVLPDFPVKAPVTLTSAALYLERHGWIQGAYYDATSGVFTPPACLVGAIGMVCYGGPVDAPAQHFDDPGFLDFEEAVLHLDRYLLVEDGSESYEFNDARGRTLADVTHVLRQAAAVPAEELIDALKAVDAANVRMVELFGSAADEDDEGNTSDCLLCGAPGGYPYCEGNFGGRTPCADVAVADFRDGDTTPGGGA
jgi:hypothetical protein